MEQKIKEELLSVLDEIQGLMYEDVETMWDDEDEDWSVVKLSCLNRCIDKIREKHSLPLFQREKD